MPQKRKLEIIEISDDEDESSPTYSTNKHHAGSDGYDDLPPISTLLSKNYYPATFSSEYRPARTTESVDVSVATASSTVAPSSHPSSRGLLAFGFTKAKRSDIGGEKTTLGLGVVFMEYPGPQHNSSIPYLEAPAYTSDVVAIIGVSRMSHRTWNKHLIKRVDDQNKDLVTLGFDVHRRIHKNCACNPSKHSIFMNGMSSNNSAAANSSERAAFKPVVDILDTLKATKEQGEILFVVSTADGFFTNPMSFNTFFQPFNNLNITYIITETENNPPRVLKVSDILQAISEINMGIKKDDDGHVFVGELMVLSVGKLIQSKGKFLVRQHTNGRNARPVTRLEDVVDRPENDTLQDPSVQVYRAFQRLTADGSPWLDFSEEKRVKLYMLENKFGCPVTSCAEFSRTKLELLAHLMRHVKSGVCPLCPEEERFLRYTNKLDCIHHVERHISPCSQVPVSKYECPFCMCLYADRSGATIHIQNVHMRSQEILGYAQTAGTLPADRDQLEELIPRARDVGANTAARKLPDLLKAVQYDGPAANNPLKLDDIIFYSLLNVGDLTNYKNQGLQDRSYTTFLGPNSRRTSHLINAEISVQSDGRFGCPINCCFTMFTDNRTAAKHVWDSKGLTSKDQCPLCTNNKKIGKLTLQHLQRHLPPTIKCAFVDCTYAARTGSDLEVHIAKMHRQSANGSRS